MATQYPGITRAALAIAYDNGGINRERPEKRMLSELEQFLARQPPDILPEIDKWLSALPDDALETICNGERDEQLSMMADAPPFTDQLLNDYFDEVC